jgi:hypothetical protein
MYQLEVWRPMGKLLEEAARLALGEDITIYDAIYIALAQRKGLEVADRGRGAPEEVPVSNAVRVALQRPGGV